MPSRKIEHALEALSRLRNAGATPEARDELRRYLADKSNLVVAKAARLVRELEFQDMQEQLAEVFARFLKDPVKTDSRCAAKTEIVRALESFGVAAETVFLQGIRHVQMEGSFGPPVDTAAELRAASAMALVHMNHPDAIIECVTLLVDREPDARIGAVRALAFSGRPEAAPLLRLKALQPEESVDVTAECFGALLEIAPARSVPFVAGYLDAHDAAVAEAAALALGQSHQPGAVDAILSRWQPTLGPPVRGALLLGLALAREENAFAFLFSLVASGSEAVAEQAIRALATYRHEERMAGRVRALVEERPSLQPVFATEFHSPRA